MSELARLGENTKVESHLEPIFVQKDMFGKGAQNAIFGLLRADCLFPEILNYLCRPVKALDDRM
jgi:hypothetical protein